MQLRSPGDRTDLICPRFRDLGRHPGPGVQHPGNPGHSFGKRLIFAAPPTTAPVLQPFLDAGDLLEENVVMSAAVLHVPGFGPN